MARISGDPATLTSLAAAYRKQQSSSGSIREYVQGHCSLDNAFGTVLQLIHPVYNQGRDAAYTAIGNAGRALGYMADQVDATLADIKETEETARKVIVEIHVKLDGATGCGAPGGSGGAGGSGGSGGGGGTGGGGGSGGEGGSGGGGSAQADAQADAHAAAEAQAKADAQARVDAAAKAQASGKAAAEAAAGAHGGAPSEHGHGDNGGHHGSSSGHPGQDHATPGAQSPRFQLDRSRMELQVTVNGHLTTIGLDGHPGESNTVRDGADTITVRQIPASEGGSRGQFEVDVNGSKSFIDLDDATKTPDTVHSGHTVVSVAAGEARVEQDARNATPGSETVPQEARETKSYGRLWESMAQGDPLGRSADELRQAWEHREGLDFTASETSATSIGYGEQTTSVPGLGLGLTVKGRP